MSEGKKQENYKLCRRVRGILKAEAKRLTELKKAKDVNASRVSKTDVFESLVMEYGDKLVQLGIHTEEDFKED